jgi:hypothetical protein
MDEKFVPLTELNEKPPLYDIVDKAFHAVANVKVKDDYLIQEKVTKKPKLAARVFASTGIGASIGLAHLVSAGFLPKFYENTFQTIEESCIYSMLMLYAFYADKIPKWSTDHPVYLAGMEAVAYTSVLLAAADLIIR